MAYISGTAGNDTAQGSSLADTINGLGGDDILYGKGGKDTLTGDQGNDRLDGGSGADTMHGSYGNDIYVVDDPGDVIFDLAGHGTDMVEASISYTLPKYNPDPFAGASPDWTPALENLILTGTAALNGTGNTLPNLIIGNSAANILSGMDGDDTLVGGLGNDTLNGGAGDDILRVAGIGSDQAYGGDGVDTLELDFSDATDAVIRLRKADGDYASAGSFRDAGGARKVSYTGIERLEVTTGSGDDDLIGGAGADVLRTGAGADKVDGGAGDDLVEGGEGDDVLVGGAGVDTVSYASSQTAVTVVLRVGGQDTRGAGVDALQGFESIIGSAHDDALTGNSAANALLGGSGKDVLKGASGHDFLDGGAGADTMEGGSGNDTYVVDASTDKLIEAASGGMDTVRSAVSWTLGADFEQLVLTGTRAIAGTGNAGSNSLSGNAASNALSGLGGDDRLDGAAGTDKLTGGTGDDVYVVDHARDVLVEAEGEGHDTVRSAVNCTLGSAFEDLVLTGTTAIRATGNGGVNKLIGNALANALEGMAGDDSLDGGAGADSMAGGTGNDHYFVDNAGDRAVELDGEGIDVVSASVSFTLGAYVENLVLTGTGHLDGAGNALANSISGNAGRNRLDGGAGADTMSGGSGNDTYVVDDAGDKTLEAPGGGTDTVLSSISHVLSADVERLTLTGSAAVNATGNGAANSLEGNSAANRLDGRAGADVMRGGAGDDIYIVDNARDIVIESAGGGSDRIFSSVSYALGGKVEQLTLTGRAAIDGTGNSLGNSISGNSAANVLDGGAGKDTLRGGLGNDSLFGGHGNDFLQGGGGADGFYFDTALSGSTNVDRLLNFSPVNDTIFLDRSIFGGIAADGVLSTGAFRSGSEAQDETDRILYDVQTGNIFYDADGTGAAAAVLFARVASGTALTHLDFSAYFPG